MELVFKTVSDLIGSAEKLGTLSAAAIWALFTLMLITYIVWDLRTKRQMSELSLQVRIKDAESDIRIADAFDKVVEEFKEFRHVIKCSGGKND